MVDHGIRCSYTGFYKSLLYRIKTAKKTSFLLYASIVVNLYLTTNKVGAESNFQIQLTIFKVLSQVIEKILFS